MATPTGRIRRGTKGFQGVSMQDNWRTEWYAKEETAQSHLDDHLEELKSSKGRAKKPKADDHSEHVHHSALVEQGASDVPPGGEDTGPRGE